MNQLESAHSQSVMLSSLVALSSPELHSALLRKNSIRKLSETTSLKQFPCLSASIIFAEKHEQA